MKKILACLFIGGALHAAGNSNPLTVSSGTYLPVDLYSNANGSNRQAVVLGDATSSDTAHVNIGQGLQVYLGTSSASGVGTLTGISSPVTVTITTVTQATAANLKVQAHMDLNDNIVLLDPNSALDYIGTINNPVTVNQPTATSLKASVLLDGSSNTIKYGDVTQTTTTIDGLNVASTITVSGNNSISVAFDTGTLSGTVYAQGSSDDMAHWNTLNFTDNTSGATNNNFRFLTSPSNDSYQLLLIGGYTHVRIICLAYTSGSVAVRLRAFQTGAKTYLYGYSASLSSPINFNASEEGAMLSGGRVGTSAPAYIDGHDRILSLTTAGALRVDGSAVTSPVYNVNVTTSPIQVQSVAGALTGVGFQSGGGSVPVQIQNTAANPVLIQSTGTLSVTVLSGSLNATFTPPAITTVSWTAVGGQATTSTSTYIVNPTTSPIQVQNVGGTLVSVGYQSGGSSVPVQIQNAVTNPVLIQSTGTLSVAIVAGAAAGGTSSNFVATFPSAGTAAGFVSSNGNMQGARVDASSNVFVQVVNITTVSQSGNWAVQPLGITTVTFNGNLSTVTFNNQGQPVTSSSTYVVNLTTVAMQIQNVGGSLISVGYQSGGGSIPVQIIGDAVQGMAVSSTALPSAQAQGSTMTATSDPMGRLFVTGLTYGLALSTWSVNVSTGTGEIILISSPTAPLRTYMCGCILKNTSATNSGISLYSIRSNLTTLASYPIGAPANYVPGGIWPGCADPFFVGAIGGQIVFKADAAATSTQMNCQYYQAP